MKNKKNFLIVLTILLGMNFHVLASALCPQPVRNAIAKYKAQDYVGCIQDLEDYSDEDPSNAVSYYYTGIAYMKVGMKDRAINAFQKVATINSIPVLSSYSIQAVNCMNNNINPCVYKKFSETDIENMIANPKDFFVNKAKEEAEGKANTQVVEDISDIDRLIKGEYPENVHPDARRVVEEARLMQEQERVNAELKKRTKGTTKEPEKKNPDLSSKESTTKIASGDLSDKEIADAVRTLSKAGYKFTAPDADNDKKNINPYKQMAAQYAMQDDYAQMALMFGNNNNRNNSFDAMLPYLLMQDKQNDDGAKRKLDPELIKAMMMNQMMGDFDLGFDNDKNK